MTLFLVIVPNCSFKQATSSANCSHSKPRKPRTFTWPSASATTLITRRERKWPRSHRALKRTSSTMLLAKVEVSRLSLKLPRAERENLLPELPRHQLPAVEGNRPHSSSCLTMKTRLRAPRARPQCQRRLKTRTRPFSLIRSTASTE